MKYDVIEVGAKTAGVPSGVFLHGFGSTAENMVNVCELLRDEIPHWLAIQAPVDMTPYIGSSGYAWFPSNLSGLINVLETGNMRSIIERYDDESIEHAADYVHACVSKYGLGDTPIVIAGYSQGGMVAGEYVIRYAVQSAADTSNSVLQALLLLSSSQVASERRTHFMDNALQAVGGQQPVMGVPPVFVAHGAGDTVLTSAQGASLRDFWKHYAPHVDFFEFDGEHEITGGEITRIREFLQSVV